MNTEVSAYMYGKRSAQLLDDKKCIVHSTMRSILPANETAGI